MTQIAAIAIAAALLYFFWKFCRAVVKWGFFTCYFVAGAIAGWVLAPNAPPWTPAVTGFAFAWAILAIKSKLFKVISAAAVLGATSLVFPTLYPKAPPEAAGTGLVRSSANKKGAGAGGSPVRPKASRQRER